LKGQIEIVVFIIIIIIIIIIITIITKRCVVVIKVKRQSLYVDCAQLLLTSINSSTIKRTLLSAIHEIMLCNDLFDRTFMLPEMANCFLHRQINIINFLATADLTSH